MYTIQRNDARVIITDWNGKVIYTAHKDAYLIYRPGGLGEQLIEKIGDMPDTDLLLALVHATKIAL